MPGMEREEMQEEPATRLESERCKVLSTSFQVMLEHQDRNRTAVETILARLSGLDRSSLLQIQLSHLVLIASSTSPKTKVALLPLKLTTICTSLTHTPAVENQCGEKNGPF